MTLVLGALFQVVSQGSLLTLLYLQRNNFLLAKMSAFEDEFEAIPPVSEVDPAAEFLAKEQEELGDIGEDLGLGAAPEKPEDIEKPSPQYYSNLELHDTMVLFLNIGSWFFDAAILR